MPEPARGPDIRPEVYRRVEALLYNYKTLADAIASLEAELDELMPSPGASIAVVGDWEGRTPHNTSPTERWALIRAEGPTAVRVAKLLERKKNDKARVERGLKALSPLERELVRLKYDQELSDHAVASTLGMPKANCWRLKRIIIAKIAIRLGWVNQK